MFPSATTTAHEAREEAEVPEPREEDIIIINSERRAEQLYSGLSWSRRCCCVWRIEM